MNAPLIIDADRHVIEPNDLWREYLPAAFRQRAPRVEGDSLVFEERPAFGHVSEAAQRIIAQQAHARMPDLIAASTGAGQLRAMERQGVDIGYLFPTYALFLPYANDLDPQLGAAMISAYNRWLYDYCSLDRERLRGVGLLGPQDPTAMQRELARVLDYGFRAVMLRPNPVRGRTLGHPDYEPFWSTCERAGIAITVHEGAQCRLPTVGADRFETRFAQHACSHPMEQMMAFLALLEAGVFERHPDLRFAFLEAGAGWLPAWLYRLDALSYPHMRQEVATTVTRLPSEYFQRQCFIAIEPHEPGLTLVAEQIGATRLLYGSDYPHLDHDELSPREQVAASALGPAAVANVLHENPLRFYGR